MTWPPNPYVLALWIIAASLIVLALVAWGRAPVHARRAQLHLLHPRGGRVGRWPRGWKPPLWIRRSSSPGSSSSTWASPRLPVAFLVFANDYTRQTAWLNRFVVTLLLVVPAITVGLAWTYPLQDVLWRSVTPVDGALAVVRGPWFWVHTGSSYLWLAIGSFYLLRGYVGTPRGYRAQVTWVLVAVAVPWVANLVFVFTNLDLPIDPTPLTFAVSAWAFAQSLLSHRLLDIVPVARETVMRHLGDPVLVLDPRQRVLQVNPAAAKLLELEDPDDGIGRTATELFHDQRDLVKALGGDAFVEHDLTWTRTEVERHLRAQVTPLRDNRGRHTGHLVRLQDIGRQVLAERTLRESERRRAEQEAYLTALQEVTNGLAARAAGRRAARGGAATRGRGARRTARLRPPGGRRRRGARAPPRRRALRGAARPAVPPRRGARGARLARPPADHGARLRALDGQAPRRRPRLGARGDRGPARRSRRRARGARARPAAR